MIFGHDIFNTRKVSPAASGAVEQSLDDRLRLGEYWIFDITPDLNFNEVNTLREVSEGRFAMAIGLNSDNQPEKAAGYFLTRATAQEKDWLLRQNVVPIFLKDQKTS